MLGVNMKHGGEEMVVRETDVLASFAAEKLVLEFKCGEQVGGC